MHRRLVVGVALSGLAVLGVRLALSSPVAPVEKDPYVAKVAKASDDWKKTAQRMRIPKGLSLDLWAAEPLVANIVSFAFDGKGRAYVAETFRLHNGVSDNRGRPWLDDDLAARTVGDRLALYRKYLGKDFPNWERDEDRVRLVEDTQGKGQADKATVFAGGFKNAVDGLGSGVLARDGKVWYTCIPDLWLLEDTKGTGHADVKKSLHTGYGVHISFLGHDSHGLRMGPDGKLYFTIGDRGLHVETGGKTLDAPDTGSVLRCNPDGSELEIVATGLRNPQELAFDAFGNLFTGDNNADGGDAARWVYVVEGGDSGWRIGYQYLPNLGPWNQERLWHTEKTNTAAYLLPPLAHIANGPSGLAYNPGATLLPKQYADHFFLSDFRGGGGGSGVHSFALKPQGAAFEVVEREQFAWGVLATDCDFGPDGGFYISDWVDGWGLPNKGRIWRIADPSRAQDAAVLQVKKLLAEGFSTRPTAELVSLLEHTDMRVRQEAQFALAAKKEAQALTGVAQKGGRFARLHAIWGLGQIARQEPKVLEAVVPLAGASDVEVRAQALRVLGDGKVASARDAIEAGLKDREPRVRFFAGMAAGKLGDKALLAATVAMVKDNADRDPYLRHAGVMALQGQGSAVGKLAEDPSSSVRLAALLALRRAGSADVAKFLADSDAKIVLEAARAINDAPIPAALPALAALTDASSRARSLPSDVQEPVLLRAVAARSRLAQKSDAAALAQVAARGDVSGRVREEALKRLLEWEKPSGRDPVIGVWRPRPERPLADVAEVVRPALPGIMTGPDRVRAEGARLAAKHGIKEVGPVLRELVADKSRSTAVRVETLKALEALRDARLDEAAHTALEDTDPRLRHEGRRILLRKSSPTEAVKQLGSVLTSGATVERQGALQLLADLKAAPADQEIGRQLDELLKGQTPAALRLDVLQAARKRNTPEMRGQLKRYEEARPKTDHLAAFRDMLEGGDAESGRKVFFEKTDVSCLRCHKIAGTGGEVGPDLTGVGKRSPREYLLESIVDPNRQIAKGFESVVLTMSDGQLKTGILRGEDAREVRLMTAEGQLIAVPKADIEERQRGPSAMPGDLVQKLTPNELRDVVEFLSTLRD